MNNSQSRLARTALLFDAAGGVGHGALLLLAAAYGVEVLGMPASLLLASGAFLVPFGVLLFALATEARVRRGALLGVIALNVAWVAASAALFTTTAAPVTTLGVVHVVLQALVVVGLAVAEAVGARRLEAVSAM